jgi:hypothetical protein
MTEAATAPQPAPFCARASDSDELIEVLAQRKDALGLSNAFCEGVGGFCEGHIDKLLGPSRARKPSLATLDALMDIFAVSFVVAEDPEKRARMHDLWERRAEAKVHPPRKVSALMIKRARQTVLIEQARKGGVARWKGMTAKQRSAAARKAIRARWAKRNQQQEENRA